MSSSERVHVVEIEPYSKSLNNAIVQFRKIFDQLANKWKKAFGTKNIHGGLYEMNEFDDVCRVIWKKNRCKI